MVGTSIVSGLGLRSTAFLGTTAVSVTVPTAPQSFTATAASSSSINLSWAAPSSNGGAAITSYTLKRGATTIYTGAGTSFTDTGLSPATGYSYTVLATNSAGNGPTASASATTSAGVPDTPTMNASGGGIEPVYDEYGEYILYYAAYYTFTLPHTNNNGSAITSSTIQVSYDSGATWNNTGTKAYPENSWTFGIPQDDNNDPWWWRGFHTNGAGNSAPSNSINLSS